MPRLLMADEPETVKWNRRKVDLWFGDRHKVLECDCIGNLAVHRKVLEDGSTLAEDCWAVSSITTGYRVVKIERREEAKRLAIHLNDRFNIEFSKGVWGIPEPLLHAMPKWTHEWLKYCNQTARFLDPASYAEQTIQPPSNAKADKPKAIPKKILEKFPQGKPKRLF